MMEWITVNQAAQRTNYTRTGIYNLLRRGHVAQCRINGRVHVSWLDVKRWTSRAKYREISGSAQNSVVAWIREHRTELENYKHGAGRELARKAAVKFGISEKHFYNILGDCGIRLCRNYATIAREYIRAHPYLAHETAADGWREFLRLTDHQYPVHLRTWRQARTEYLKMVHEDQER